MYILFILDVSLARLRIKYVDLFNMFNSETNMSFHQYRGNTTWIFADRMFSKFEVYLIEGDPEGDLS